MFKAITLCNLKTTHKLRFDLGERYPHDSAMLITYTPREYVEKGYEPENMADANDFLKQITIFKKQNKIKGSGKIVRIKSDRITIRINNTGYLKEVYVYIKHGKISRVFLREWSSVRGRKDTPLPIFDNHLIYESDLLEYINNNVFNTETTVTNINE